MKLRHVGDTSIGFIGLGSMGGSLVRALTGAGHEPRVFDLNPAAVAVAVEHGAVAAESIDGVAADIVGICVANDAQVRSVLESGVLDHLPTGAVVTLHSTLKPETVVWAAERTASQGIGLVEAPVAGGAAAAAEGRVTFMLSGDPAHIAAAEPLLDACAGLRIDAGPFGHANLLKLCVNLQTYVTHMAVGEAAAFARSLGVSLDALKAAMEANGQLGELNRNYFVLQELSEEIAFDPGLLDMRVPLISIIAKDIGLMAELASGVGEVPAVQLAGQRLGATYRMPDELVRPNVGVADRPHSTS